MCVFGFCLLIDFGDDSDIGLLDVTTLQDVSEPIFLSNLGTSCSLTLEMLEPDLTSPNGLAEWTSWFDKLKSNRDIVADHLNLVTVK